MWVNGEGACGHMCTRTRHWVLHLTSAHRVPAASWAAFQVQGVRRNNTRSPTSSAHGEMDPKQMASGGERCSEEKWSTEAQECSRVGQGALLDSGREGIADEVAFEQEWGGDMSSLGFWGRGFWEEETISWKVLKLMAKMNLKGHMWV